MAIIGSDSNQNAAAAGPVAESFVAARLDARALTTFPGAVPTTLEHAYQLQDVAIRRWPDPVAGWKVARVAPGWQKTFPEERLIGPAFHRNLHLIGDGAIAECPVFAGGFAAVEAEIVIVIGENAPKGKADWTIDAALPLIGSMHIGIEVASSPLATLNDLGPGAVISDFGNNWGIVVGPIIVDWPEVTEIAVESFIDDVSIGTAKVNLINGPFGALLFTLRKCAERGRPLRAGDVITTGMITGVHDIVIGQRSRHVFSGYGEIGCHAIQATRYLAATAGGE